ncbi:hypothetical protein SH139x_000273 [Planctomycetaceae bacterium SH139]
MNPSEKPEDHLSALEGRLRQLTPRDANFKLTGAAPVVNSGSSVVACLPVRPAAWPATRLLMHWSLGAAVGAILTLAITQDSLESRRVSSSKIDLAGNESAPTVAAVQPTPELAEEFTRGSFNAQPIRGPLRTPLQTILLDQDAVLSPLALMIETRNGQAFDFFAFPSTGNHRGVTNRNRNGDPWGTNRSAAPPSGTIERAMPSDELPVPTPTNQHQLRRELLDVYGVRTQ